MNRRRLPAEWERQGALLLTWPHGRGAWGRELAAAEATFVQLATALHDSLRLIISCRNAAQLRRVARLLCGGGIPRARLSLYPCASNDVWVRDHGPLAVIENGEVVFLDFRFDGWGRKYPAHLDDQLSQTLHGLGGLGAVTMRRVDQVLEGGGIESDGQGSLISTSSYLARSFPGLPRAVAQQRLREYFGDHRLLVLEHGKLSGDDTDGHVDMLVRFVSPDTLVHAACDDPAHPDYEALQSVARQVQSWRRSDGSPYQLHALRVPPYRPRDVAPRSYVNFLISNDRVLMPTYDCATDQFALQTLRACLPRYQVAGLDCSCLIRHGGALHCATLPVPDLSP